MKETSSAKLLKFLVCWKQLEICNPLYSVVIKSGPVHQKRGQKCVILSSYDTEAPGLWLCYLSLVCRKRMCVCWGLSRKWTPPRARVHCGIWMRTQNTLFMFRASAWEAAAPLVSRSSSELPKSRRRWRPRAQVRDINVILDAQPEVYVCFIFEYYYNYGNSQSINIIVVIGIWWYHIIYMVNVVLQYYYYYVQ